MTIALIAAALGWRQRHPAPLGVTVTEGVGAPLAPMGEGLAPDFDGAVAWLNSEPVSSRSLRGKVVLVDIWTYSCINSLRELPYVKSWAAKYKDAGLVVIGVHSPEFSFEKERPNVEWAVRNYSVAYPVPMDNNFGIWRSLDNEYWPADYLIDGTGRVRYHHFGEGDYDETEHEIQKLLKENSAKGLGDETVPSSGNGIEAPPSRDVQTPETYVGYRRADQLLSPERLARDAPQSYTAPTKLALNQWGFGGMWNVGGESAVPQAPGAAIVFRFHARDLHIVLGPSMNGKTVRFRVKLDGSPPGDDHGLDTAPDGSGEIREPRLYQLIRQKHGVKDRTFEIEFLDPGARAYVFTFG